MITEEQKEKLVTRICKSLETYPMAWAHLGTNLSHKNGINLYLGQDASSPIQCLVNSPHTIIPVFTEDQGSRIRKAYRSFLQNGDDKTVEEAYYIFFLEQKDEGEPPQGKSFLGKIKEVFRLNQSGDTNRVKSGWDDNGNPYIDMTDRGTAQVFKDKVKPFESIKTDKTK